MIEIVIPARMKSSRLPDKIIKKIGDKTLIQHVYENASKTGFPVTIVTDDEIIQNILPDAKVVIIPSANNGTERVAKYAAEGNDDDIIVNCQGDLPFVTKEAILSAILACHYADVGTVVTKMTEENQDNPNAVKAICSESFNSSALRAHWFLRASLKYGYHHIGIYAFRRKVLREYLSANETQFEDLEKLEQLRWLSIGKTIAALEVTNMLSEVNTQEDLDNAIKIYSSKL